MAKGTLALRQIQLGDNADTSKNFLISVPAVADGTLVIERGNGTDVLSIAADGAVIVTGQLIGNGTTTNDNATAGQIGEHLSNSGSSLIVTATPRSVVQLSLTAGDWDVSGEVSYTSAGTHTINRLKQGISIVNNTFDATHFTADIYAAQSYNPTSTGPISHITPVSRISLAAPTTVYLIAQGDFVTAGLTAAGFIRARRVR